MEPRALEDDYSDDTFVVVDPEVELPVPADLPPPQPRPKGPRRRDLDTAAEAGPAGSPSAGSVSASTTTVTAAGSLPWQQAPEDSEEHSARPGTSYLGRRGGGLGGGGGGGVRDSGGSRSARRSAETMNQSVTRDEFSAARFPTASAGEEIRDNVYSGDEVEEEPEYSDDDGGSEDDDESMGPTLFIDSGNNKDSPPKYAGKPVVLAAAAGDSGDESMLGNSADLEALGDGGVGSGMMSMSTTGGRRSAAHSRQPSLAAVAASNGSARGRISAEGTGALPPPGGDGAADSAAVGADGQLTKVPEEEAGAVMADESLLSLPSLDIVGDGGGRPMPD